MKTIAERLIEGESFPVEQMLEAAESFIDLALKQQKEIEELRRLLRAAKCPQNCVKGAVPDGYGGCYQCEFCDKVREVLGEN